MYPELQDPEGAARPTPLQYFPGAQGVHSERALRRVAPHVPDGHFVAALEEPAGQTDPAGQSILVLLPEQKEPAGHVVQVAAPAMSAKVPAVHAIALLDPLGQACPTGQIPPTTDVGFGAAWVEFETQK